MGLTKHQLGTGLLIVIFALQASAKTNVDAKVEQLKENTQNSKTNLKQYEDNLKIVEENLAENQKAIKALQVQRTGLQKQSQETAKGKVGVESAKKQLTGYIANEQRSLETEKKQIADIERTLAQLKANAATREQNIAEYNAKLSNIDGEMAAWADKNQSITELEKEITAKEKQAIADQAALRAKKSTYEDEIVKWKKQVRVSERQHDNFSKIKD
jgi:chromosome segregation ATPase